jgi:fatty acid-binding protein DegV
VRTSGAKPTTAALREDEFATAARQLFERGNDAALVILSARALSDLSHQGAERAAAELGAARLAVLDTGTNSGASAAIALEAAQRAATGTELGELAASVGTLVPRAMAVTALPTPETFKRGGRMGDATALAGRGPGSIAVIAVRGAEGAVAPVGKVATIDEAHEMMRDALREFVASLGAKRIRVLGKHAAAEANARRLVDEAVAVGECVSRHVVPFHNSVVAHLGAGAWSAGVLALDP